jgi:Mg/Co/Ni transporter MgtE
MFQNIFPYLVPCIALTLLPGLFGVFKSYRSESDSAQKVLWRNSLIGIVLSVLITSFVALPLNFMIWIDNTPASEIETLLVIWLIMHAARLAAAFGGVVYAMKALNTR